jgi:hypothetical protein
MALRDAGRASMAYFYFDFRDVDKQKLHNLLPSLLIQLSARSDPCCDILSRLYSAHDRGVRKPSDRAMVECLKEMLTLEAQGPTYIIMDALDECPITSSSITARRGPRACGRTCWPSPPKISTYVLRVGLSTTFRLSSNA